MNAPGRMFRLGNLPDFSGGGPTPPLGIPPPSNLVSGPGGRVNQELLPSQSYWQSFPFLVGTNAVMIQNVMPRKFMLMQNLDPSNTLYFGFGWKPNIYNGLTLPPGWGYEPYSYPVNEIWVAASGANTAGYLITGA